jgi:hypothetical protein
MLLTGWFVWLVKFFFSTVVFYLICWVALSHNSFKKRNIALPWNPITPSLILHPETIIFFDLKSQKLQQTVEAVALALIVCPA